MGLVRIAETRVQECENALWTVLQLPGVQDIIERELVSRLLTDHLDDAESLRVTVFGLQLSQNLSRNTPIPSAPTHNLDPDERPQWWQDHSIRTWGNLLAFREHCEAIPSLSRQEGGQGEGSEMGGVRGEGSGRGGGQVDGRRSASPVERRMENRLAASEEVAGKEQSGMDGNGGMGKADEIAAERDGDNQPASSSSRTGNFDGVSYSAWPGTTTLQAADIPINGARTKPSFDTTFPRSMLAEVPVCTNGSGSYVAHPQAEPSSSSTNYPSDDPATRPINAATGTHPTLDLMWQQQAQAGDSQPHHVPYGPSIQFSNPAQDTTNSAPLTTSQQSTRQTDRASSKASAKLSRADLFW